MNEIISESDKHFEENDQGNVTMNERQGGGATVDEIVGESPTEEMMFRPLPE